MRVNFFTVYRNSIKCVKIVNFRSIFKIGSRYSIRYKNSVQKLSILGQNECTEMNKSGIKHLNINKNKARSYNIRHKQAKLAHTT